MIKKTAVVTLLLLVISSCKNMNDLSNNEIDISKKWYTNAEDDRYYCEFKPDGSLNYRYYQSFGSSSGLNSFITKIGTWRYLGDNKIHFAVGWDDSIECYYYITEANTEYITIEKDTNGPAGRGLGTISILLNNATDISFVVPDEIVNLIGIWFYDETKDGKYLKFQNDGICMYHYYQDYGPNSGLTGWVNKNGEWFFNVETQILSITMSGEASCNYIIELLSDTTLILSGSSSSIIYNSDQFYK